MAKNLSNSRGIKNCEEGGNYHDSFETSATQVALDKTWTKYAIDLSGKDLKTVTGSFR